MKTKKTNHIGTGRRGWVQAAIFDLDGVVTDTAEAHARAWQQMFDEYLETREKRYGESLGRFDPQSDYLTYVDGKPRYDGVESFLQSRGIDLARGALEDPPDRQTICGLGNRKNELFQKFIDRGRVEVYPEVIEVIGALKSRQVKTAIVSSSKNCPKVLTAAKISDLFDVRVDGNVSAALNLKGKPAPDIFLKAAAELNVSPEHAVVFEDAIAGVQAGCRGYFGSVIGVDRTGKGRELKDHGADLVVQDLSETDIERLPQRRNTSDLASALERIDEITPWPADQKAAFFLDYDGTLTPIVERPEQADLSDRVRGTLKAMAEQCTVAIVSGRGLDDVKGRVGLENLIYAGSHGFEIDLPGQARIRSEKGGDALPALDEAEQTLRKQLADIDGALVERKKFSVAVHFRRVAREQEAAVAQVVDDVLKRHSGLRKGQGKKVFELQPDVEWDKGRAVRWLMDRMNLESDEVRPIYIGDDVTDEDAFRDLQTIGVGIVVTGGESRRTYAGYSLVDPAEVRRFLQGLVDEKAER